MGKTEMAVAAAVVAAEYEGSNAHRGGIVVKFV
jgi:hypothetical protein